MNLKERAKQLLADIPVLFFAIKHKDTPFLAKCLAGVAVVYAVSPIDLIPDFIPVIGYLDDILLLPVLITIAIKMIPQSVMAECREDAKNHFGENIVVKWYYSLPVIAVWAVLAWWLIRMLAS